MLGKFSGVSFPAVGGLTVGHEPRHFLGLASGVVVIDGVRQGGEVVEVGEPLVRSIQDRVGAVGGGPVDVLAWCVDACY